VNTSCHFNNCLKPSSGYVGEYFTPSPVDATNQCSTVVRVDTGSLTVFQGLDTSALSIAAWVTTPSSISSGTIVYKSGMISLVYTASCSLLCPYSVLIPPLTGLPHVLSTHIHNISHGPMSNAQLQCTFTFNSQQSQTVSVGSSPFSSSTAYHVACTYDGQQMCLYINGVSKVRTTFFFCSPATGD
jgi:hypothetical protein